jgi:hypothetical protein
VLCMKEASTWRSGYFEHTTATLMLSYIAAVQCASSISCGETQRVAAVVKGKMVMKARGHHAGGGGGLNLVLPGLDASAPEHTGRQSVCWLHEIIGHAVLRLQLPERTGQVVLRLQHHERTGHAVLRLQLHKITRLQLPERTWQVVLRLQLPERRS